MRFNTTGKLAALLATALLTPAAHAHPGHEHSPGAVASLVHSITGWGPLLALLVAITAVGCLLWQARGK
jgi:hypothetical protein